MPDIFLRHTLTPATDIALCDPTVPCTPPVVTGIVVLASGGQYGGPKWYWARTVQTGKPRYRIRRGPAPPVPETPEPIPVGGLRVPGHIPVGSVLDGRAEIDEVEELEEIQEVLAILGVLDR